jgi:hypothetical protein
LFESPESENERERERKPSFFAEPLETNHMSEELVEPSSDAVC